MCPFCIGAAAWAAAGALTTAGLGTLFVATLRGGTPTSDGDDGGSAPRSSSADHHPIDAGDRRRSGDGESAFRR